MADAELWGEEMNRNIVEFSNLEDSLEWPDEHALEKAVRDAVDEFGLQAFAASLVIWQQPDLQKLAA